MFCSTIVTTFLLCFGSLNNIDTFSDMGCTCNYMSAGVAITQSRSLLSFILTSEFPKPHSRNSPDSSPRLLLAMKGHVLVSLPCHGRNAFVLS